MSYYSKIDARLGANIAIENLAEVHTDSNGQI